MFDVIRGNPRRAVLIFSTVLFVSLAYVLLVVQLTRNENNGYIGATLDDSWIYIRYASRIADGKGLSYNEGELSTGATGILWALMLATIYAITDPTITGEVEIAIALGGFFYVVSVLAITGFGWYATRRAWIGLVAGLLTALAGRLVWMGLSGMEVTAFTAFSIFAIWSHTHDLRENRACGWRTGILAALATLLRPEAYLLVVLIAIDHLIVVPLKNRVKKRVSSVGARLAAPNMQGGVNPAPTKNILIHWRGALAYLLLAGSYPLVCLMITGHPLPSTFRVKAETHAGLPAFKSLIYPAHFDYTYAIVPLIFIGMGILLWRVWKKEISGITWIVWAEVFIFVLLMVNPGAVDLNMSRYVAPMIPFQLLLITVSIQFFTDLLAQKPLLQKTVMVSFIGMIFAAVTIRGAESGLRVPRDVRLLREMHVNVGYWMRDQTEPDELIAMNDVGVITHISNRRVLDMEGLVSPEVTDAIQGTERFTCERDLVLARLFLKERPEFVAIYDWWYPCLFMFNWRGAFQPIATFTIENGVTVISGNPMIIAYPVWENFPILAEIPSDTIPVGAQFSEGVELATYEVEMVEGGLQVTLFWKATAQPQGDYHVFVHLIDGAGNPVGQHDSKPQNNQFSMVWWRDGDLIKDSHFIALPDPLVLNQEGVQLRIGVYYFTTGRRLARLNGNEIEFDMVLIPLVIRQ